MDPIDRDIDADNLVRGGSNKRKRSVSPRPYSMITKIPDQVRYLDRMVHTSDADCIVNLRMDRNTFGKLCRLLRELGGLQDQRYVTIEEQVAIFLGVLAHQKKNSVVSCDFRRSGQTVSSYVHIVLRAVIKLHAIFLAKPIPVDDKCSDERWKWFKGCLGALDGCHTSVIVPNIDKPRYRSRNGQICTNTLAACDRSLRFVYILVGWEGSAANGRVLRDATNRVNGLKVPKGNYYLCDNGYANSEGFLTPYKGVRYDLKEWGPDSNAPQNPEEMFNLRHTKARNIIERAFGIMKARWGILRSGSHYPVKVQNRLIMACFMLHNFIRGEMADDPIEEMIDENESQLGNDDHDTDEDFVDTVEATAAWNQKRDEMAQMMFSS